MISALLLGLLLGMRHTIEADHLAAVATLSSNAKTTGAAVRQGMFWGIGHTAALFLFCSVVVVFDTSIPANAASWLEFVVGIMVLVLGADMIRRTYKLKIHFHTHKHDSNKEHFHAHAHPETEGHTEVHNHEHVGKNTIRPLAVGIVHGLAGTAALMVLVFQSVESAITALVYTLVFGVGSIIGMAILSVAIAIPFRMSANIATRLHNSLHYTLGSVSLCIGAFMAYSHLPL